MIHNINGNEYVLMHVIEDKVTAQFVCKRHGCIIQDINPTVNKFFSLFYAHVKHKISFLVPVERVFDFSKEFYKYI